MKHGIISDVIETVGMVESHTIINFRPSDKILAMLNLMTDISGKSYSSEISKLIPSLLVEFMEAYVKDPAPLLDAVEKILTSGEHEFQKGSALATLNEVGYIKYELPITEKDIKLMCIRESWRK